MDLSSVRNRQAAQQGYRESVVSDQRWVHRNQLKRGMYVVELDVPWENTPFMFQGFFLDNQKQVDQVQAHCEYALVKTEKIARKSLNSYKRMCGAVK
ncbi:MAG: DUF3391 domain-containing protein [Gammaproteobacteria bacterium]|nr:DUF3391 domain-containing protein [Gammaproteobacteria bacterium]